MNAKAFGEKLRLPATLLSLSVFVFPFTARAGFNQYSVGLNFGSDNANNGTRPRAMAGTDVAGLPAVAQTNWNNIPGASGSSTVTGAIVDNSGAATTLGVDWFSPLGTWSSGANSDNFLPSSGDQIMMMGYLDNGTTTTVTITNIPGALTAYSYDVYVYTLFDAANRGGTYSIVNPADSSVLKGPLFLNSDSNPTNYVQYPAGNTNRSGNYLVFRGLTNANIQLVTVADHGGTIRSAINGIQLVSSPTAGESGPASGLSVATNAGTGRLAISWTPGSGSAGSLVVMRAGYPVTASPVDGVTYAANSVFGSGSNLGDDNLGAGNYVVFAGSGNSVTVTNLFGATTYYVAVYSFSGSAGTTDYSLANAPTATGSPSAVLIGATLVAPSAPVVAGSARNVIVIANYDDGGTVDVSASASLASSAPNIVTIAGPGRLAALANGTATITAVYQGFTNSQPVTVTGLSMTHRYSFNGDLGETNVVDATAAANGVVISPDATSGLNGSGQVVLSGGTSNYVQMPPDLLTNYGAVTFEMWATVTATANWIRFLDFGSGTIRDLFFTPNAGNATTVRGAITINGNAAGAEQQVNGVFPGAGAEHQYVWVIAGASQTSRLYIDGSLANVNTNTIVTPEDVGPTSNDWLGRSQYADPYLNGSISELRIYNGELSPLQIAIDGATGSDVITNDPGALLTSTLTLTNSMNVGDVAQAILMGTFANLPNPMNLTALPQTTYQTTAGTVVTASPVGLVTAVGPGIATVRAIAFGQTNSVTITVTELPTILAHRYSFNDAPGVGGNTFVDSIAGANGLANGGTITNDGTRVLMAGTGSFNSNPAGDYVSLPEDILSTYNSITLETWFTDETAANWSRVWDFGAQSGGNGARYLFLTSVPGNRTGFRTALLTPLAGEQQVNYARPSQFSEHHVVYTSDAVTRTALIYVDGVLRARNINVTGQPRDLAPAPDSWLGRSQFNPDTWFRGSINEFRIWRGAIPAAQVALSFAAGPDTLITNLTGFASVTVPNLRVGEVQQASLGFAGATLDKPLLGAMSGVVSNWLSSDPAVANVDENGTVTAVGAGSATISATFNGTTRTSSALTVSAAGPALAHRYSFTSDLSDSVGIAHGTNAGTALVTGGTLLLDGGVTSFIGLPGIVFTNDNVTFEIWMTYSNNIAAHARAWDFGDGANTNYFGFAPSDAANPTAVQGQTFLRYNYGDRAPLGSIDERNLQHQGRMVSGGTNKIHYVWVFNQNAQKAELYFNGALEDTYPYGRLVNAAPLLSRMSSIVEGYLGHAVRTNTGGSFPAANLVGAIDEFRIWDGALTRQQAAASYALGPDAANPLNPGALQSVSLVLNDATMVLGTIQRPTVRGTFASAGTIDLTRGLGVAYSSGNPAVVAVGADDRLNAVGVGVANVVASYGGLSATGTVAVVAKPALKIAHRYSFAADARDSVGRAHGVLKGNARILTNHVVLDGSTSPNTYVDLPSDIISGFDKLTIEAFLTVGPSGNQGRLFDFGDHVNAANVPAVGWPSYLFMSPPGGNGTSPRFAHFPNPGAAGTEVGIQGTGDLRNRADHIVAMMDSAAHTLTLYTNGVAAGTVTNASVDIALLSDVYSMLGRSQWNDAFLTGNLNEFRIYYGTMTPAEITASGAAGPDPETLAATAGPGGVTVAWPAVPVLEGYALQMSPSLAPPNWQSAGSPTVVGGFNQVTVSPTNAVSFFRLIK